MEAVDFAAAVEKSGTAGRFAESVEYKTDCSADDMCINIEVRETIEPKGRCLPDFFISGCFWERELQKGQYENESDDRKTEY